MRAPSAQIASPAARSRLTDAAFGLLRVRLSQGRIFPVTIRRRGPPRREAIPPAAQTASRSFLNTHSELPAA